MSYFESFVQLTAQNLTFIICYIIINPIRKEDDVYDKKTRIFGYANNF